MKEEKILIELDAGVELKEVAEKMACCMAGQPRAPVSAD